MSSFLGIQLGGHALLCYNFSATLCTNVILDNGELDAIEGY